MKKLPKHVHGYVDRLGKARFYYKRKGIGAKGIPLPGLPWSPQFMAAYDLAHAVYQQPAAVPLGASRTHPGSLNAALVQYYASANFRKELADSTRGPQRSLLERWRKDRGEFPLKLLQPGNIQSFISKLESPSVAGGINRTV
jgi:hypothetical protein